MNKKSFIWILVGLLLWAAAGGLIGYNRYLTRRGGETKEAILEQLVPMIPEVREYIEVGTDGGSTEQVIADYVLNPDMEMPTIEIDGRDCIGVLEIPEIDLMLPVISEWSYPAMSAAPCRYQGNLYQHDLVLAGHNYETHFGQLPKLHAGNAVRFTDVDGNCFCYEVVETETIDADGIEQMISGDWDLTLFTCTVGGRARFTVRCIMTEA